MYMWMDYFSSHNDLEYVLSLDRNDAEHYMPVIQEMLGQMDLKVVIHSNTSMVEALNVGCQQATGDVLVYVSDDFECFSNWDLAVQEATKHMEDDWFLLVNDGIQQITATIIFESRKYYERYGYMYYPRYQSMFADPDATEVARRTNKLVSALHILFKHNHHSIGGMPFDGVYDKQGGSVAWNHGETVYREREGRNFDV